MCLAIPQKIKSLKSQTDCVLDDGRMVDVSLVDKPQRGDWLLVTANLAINKLTASEAKEILNLAQQCPHN